MMITMKKTHHNYGLTHVTMVVRRRLFIIRIFLYFWVLVINPSPL